MFFVLANHAGFSTGGQRAAADQVAGFLGNHDRRAVGVAAGHVGHDRSVDHAQTGHAVNGAARGRPRHWGRCPSRKCRPDAGWCRRWRGCARRSLRRSGPRRRESPRVRSGRPSARCRRSCAQAAGPARAVTKSASLSNRLSRIAGSSRGSGDFKLDPAPRLRVEQDHVGAECVLGALDEAGEPQVRAELRPGSRTAGRRAARAADRCAASGWRC